MKTTKFASTLKSAGCLHIIYSFEKAGKMAKKSLKHHGYEIENNPCFIVPNHQSYIDYTIN